MSLLDWQAGNAGFKGKISPDRMQEVRGRIKALPGIA